MPSPSGPLHGLRVIDLTSIVMGPYATQMLADYGADVIKVESPGGDVMRKTGPMRNADMGAMYLQMNRNKRSIVLDLKQTAARDALIRLCKTADILLHNVRLRSMRRLKLGPEDLAAVNPRLIYASLIGFGEMGPYAGRPAYDDLMQGFCAIPTLSMRAGAEEPRYVPLAFIDRLVGMSAVPAVLAAVIHRARTGMGQSIEIPMFETMSQFVLSDHLGGHSFEPPIGEMGYSRILSVHRAPYRTRDGYVCLLVYNDKQWKEFFEAIGRADEFASNPRFSNQTARAQHYDEIYGFVAEALRTKTTAEWIAIFRRHDLPCAPMNDLTALRNDPHLEVVGFFELREHPSEGKLRYLGIPGRWSHSQPDIYRDAPRLGEHSVEILREAGMEEAEINSLIKSGACFSADTAVQPAK
ncbi:MAG TPA: CoA transferase [Xanthobacteraceae bacterium]|nr:CoA transferase [Xanthobacteraceae bacterium]